MEAVGGPLWAVVQPRERWGAEPQGLGHGRQDRHPAGAHRSPGLMADSPPTGHGCTGSGPLQGPSSSACLSTSTGPPRTPSSSSLSDISVPWNWHQWTQPGALPSSLL